MTTRATTGQLIGPVLSAILLLACATGAQADASSRQCLRTCGPVQRSCLALARTRTGALRAACTGARSARASCRNSTRAVLRTAAAGCRRLRKDCRACCRAGGQGPACPVGRPVAFEPPPPPDLTAAHLPRLANGQFLVLVIPGAQLTIDPTLRDPVTALGACTAWITACVDPARSLDDCARSALPCATERPWEEAAACCPATCFEAYQQARRAGAEPLAAYGRVYFKEPDCFPGLRDLLAGAGS